MRTKAINCYISVVYTLLTGGGASCRQSGSAAGAIGVEYRVNHCKL